MISDIKFYISLMIARTTYFLIKTFTKSSGTALAGKLVLKYYPDFLKHCSKYVRDSIITITGTNGKTTTSGLISHVLEEYGKKVIHNLKGANMLTGIANEFALELGPRTMFDNAVLESDEAYLHKLYDYVSADYLVVTNLFRDQLDRYGELATTAKYIQKGIDKNKKLTLILNADDPLVADFANNSNRVIFYGFEDIKYTYENGISKAPSENITCTCGKTLNYTAMFFAQQGHYYCICGKSRPKCKYDATAEIHKEFSIIKINGFEYKTNLVGLYNAYNALASIVFALEYGIKPQIISNALSTYHAIFGRTEKRVINGHNVLIQLIKNPTGASEVLKTVDLNANIVIAINDNFADGRDISWLWDSDFEYLKNAKNKLIASGTRANDMAIRLKYAGVPQEKITVMPSIKNAIEIATSSDDNNNVTILPSYTALLNINKEKF